MYVPVIEGSNTEEHYKLTTTNLGTSIPEVEMKPAAVTTTVLWTSIPEEQLKLAAATQTFLGAFIPGKQFVMPFLPPPLAASGLTRAICVSKNCDAEWPKKFLRGVVNTKNGKGGKGLHSNKEINGNL
jgi:hypothetical protein